MMNRTRDSAHPRTVFLRPSQLAQSLHHSSPEGCPLLCSVVSLSVSRCELGVKPGFAVPCQVTVRGSAAFIHAPVVLTGTVSFSLFFFFSSLHLLFMQMFPSEVTPQLLFAQSPPSDRCLVSKLLSVGSTSSLWPLLLLIVGLALTHVCCACARM